MWKILIGSRAPFSIPTLYHSVTSYGPQPSSISVPANPNTNCWLRNLLHINSPKLMVYFRVLYKINNHLAKHYPETQFIELPVDLHDYYYM
jgi:hypothetical protein